MVSEIRIYVEGGGDQRLGRRSFRKGFRSFFNEIVEKSRAKNIKWTIMPCGGRSSTYDDYVQALKDHPDAFNILLVDSEGPVPAKSGPWHYLKNREEDKWVKPKGTKNENCHLMVQIMESWLLADVAVLKKFYDQNFNENSLPKNPKVETISKSDIENRLTRATVNTQKGEYHKIRHGPKILELLDVLKVRNAAPHCDRLFNTLEDKIRSN